MADTTDPNYVILDDSDSNITYTGSWNLAGSNQEYGDSTHATAELGAKATIEFYGSSIQIYGTISIENGGSYNYAAVSNYTLDSNTNNITTFTALPGTNVEYNQLFYESPTVVWGAHKLVLECAMAGRSNIWFDYARVGIAQTAATTAVVAPTNTAGSSTTSKVASSGTSTSGLVSGPLTTTTGAAHQPSGSSLSKGAIAGIAVGAVAATCLFIIMLLLFRIWRKSSTKGDTARSNAKRSVDGDHSSTVPSQRYDSGRQPATPSEPLGDKKNDEKEKSEIGPYDIGTSRRSRVQSRQKSERPPEYSVV